MALFLFIGRASTEANDWVRHSHTVRNQIETLIRHLADADRMARDYQLTRNLPSLDLLGQELRETSVSINQLRVLVADNAEQLGRIAEVQALAEQAQAELRQLTQLPATAPAPPNLIESHRWTVRAMRAILVRMEASETLLLDRRLEQMLQLRDVTVVAMGIAWAVVVLSGALGMYLFLADIQRIDQLRLDYAESDDDEPPQRPGDEIDRLGLALRNSLSRLRAREESLVAAQAAATKAQGEAEQANRAKSEFLSRMSHELRTPLNAIIGFGQILQLEAERDGDQEIARHILKAGDYLLGMINEVLDITRIESGRVFLSIEPVLVDELLQEAYDLTSSLAGEHGIQISTDNCAEGAFLLADRQRIKQVLLNLISNAIKYNKKDGTVLVRSSHSTEQRIRVEVIDSGIGIKEEHRERLFVPFDRLGAEASGVEGSGIGLALSKQLVQAMNGQIGFSSTIGVGSTFWVDLPCVQEPVDLPSRLSEQKAHHPGHRRGTGGQVVLYIEDNLSNLTLLKRIFVHRPHLELMSVQQGRLGIDLAVQAQPQLILLDLHLPDLHGEAVLKILKAEPATAHIPVVVISADASPGQVQRLLAAGAREYLAKPFDVQRLLQVVDGLLEGSQTA